MPFQDGLAPSVRASGPKAISTVPFEWGTLAGRTWHSVQARKLPSLRWMAWAPTAREEVAVSPFVPRGGAAENWGLRAVSARVASPWQDEQASPATSTLPFMWLARLTDVAV